MRACSRDARAFFCSSICCWSNWILWFASITCCTGDVCSETGSLLEMVSFGGILSVSFPWARSPVVSSMIVDIFPNLIGGIPLFRRGLRRDCCICQFTQQQQQIWIQEYWEKMPKEMLYIWPRTTTASLLALCSKFLKETQIYRAKKTKRNIKRAKSKCIYNATTILWLNQTQAWCLNLACGSLPSIKFIPKYTWARPWWRPLENKNCPGHRLEL